MKILTIIAAAGLAFIAPTAASAAVAPAHEPIAATSSVAAPQTRVRISVGDQRSYQRRHHGRRAYWRKSCRTTWRHGHRMRTCRNVRYWR